MIRTCSYHTSLADLSFLSVFAPFFFLPSRSRWYFRCIFRHFRTWSSVSYSEARWYGGLAWDFSVCLFATAGGGFLCLSSLFICFFLPCFIVLLMFLFVLLPFPLNPGLAECAQAVKWKQEHLFDVNVSRFEFRGSLTALAISYQSSVTRSNNGSSNQSSIKQPINQSINQSNDLSIYRSSIIQSINQTIKQ